MKYIVEKVKLIGLILLLSILPHSLIAEDGDFSINQDISIAELSENVWLHTSYIEIPPWGRIGANGLILISDDNLVLIDTPWNDKQTSALVGWFESNFQFKTVLVIVGHFHEDNMGGLGWIHRQGWESYSLQKTRDICRSLGLTVPVNRLKENDYFDFEEIPLLIFYPGPGHTEDSLSVYLPDQRILFGGCSVKAHSNRGLGNTADADLDLWPESLKNLKRLFPYAEIVVPGHGAPGDLGLIDHTLSLFN